MADRSVFRYDGVAQLFHWVIAILIFVIFGLGWYMSDLEPADPETFRLYQIHKGIGVTIFGLALLRLLWRLTHKAPPLPETLKGWERLAATGAHGALYGLILLQPLIGILQSNAANFPIVLWGSVELPALIGQDQAMGETLIGVHHLIAKVLAFLILAHIAAALRHHLLLKDDVLRRMLPGAAVGVAVVILAVGFLGPFFVATGTGPASEQRAAVANRTTVTNTTTVDNRTAPAASSETAAAPAAAPATDGPSSTDTATDPAPPAGTWAVEDGSVLGFVAKQQGSPVEGRFEAFEALIRFDPEDLEASRLDVEIDATSIATGHSDRDQMLNSPSFFDTKQWPKASFASREIARSGEGQYEATADLTIRDVTREVSLPFTLEITDDPEDPARELAHAVGALPIMRLDYGVGQGDWASTTTVADEVVITIDIKASRARAD